uniref:Uncharacterized protein n=1 Tax=Neobodo designis TaxID=312471 RepID=A0A7S1W2C7_NEODS|mmetsp:Transcript_50052/g.154641  ORF Transcript_50052/g.154641 Transcript_50052/m.154641 type:complete len:331 (+) Transcript_50052:146-1138(+)
MAAVQSPPSGNSADLRGMIRQVLSEEANKRRADANRIGFAPAEAQGSSRYASSGSNPHRADSGAGSPDDRFRALRDRVATLEDVLIKSEADRAAVYERCDQATQSLRAAHEERAALIHSLHEAGASSANAVELEAAQREVMALRDHVERLEYEKTAATTRAEEAERNVKQLKKEKKRILAETDGVSLADLHYSNERLSAQLTQLQRQQQAHEGQERAADANRIAELDMAVRTLTNELTAVEQRVATSRAAHDDERRRLQEQLDRQFRDFSVERAECDAVVQAMGSKLEALNFRVDHLQSENAQLKQQLITAQAQAAALQATHTSVGRVKR